MQACRNDCVANPGKYPLCCINGGGGIPEPPKEPKEPEEDELEGDTDCWPDPSTDLCDDPSYNYLVKLGCEKAVSYFLDKGILSKTICTLKYKTCILCCGNRASHNQDFNVEECGRKCLEEQGKCFTEI